jgi:hypothetical protein
MMQRDEAAKARELEPRHLASLLQKGALIEARGDARNAARAYRNALATLPPGVTPPPTVLAAAEHARQGVAQPAHLARCPRTAQGLKGAPQCDVAGHGPNAFFSILKAGTHIPPDRAPRAVLIFDIWNPYRSEAAGSPIPD